jgi:hypothetical protein
MLIIVIGITRNAARIPREVCRTSLKKNFSPQAQTEFVDRSVRVQVTQRKEETLTAYVALGPVGKRGKQVGVTCMFSLDRKISMCVVRVSITMAQQYDHLNNTG